MLEHPATAALAAAVLSNAMAVALAAEADAVQEIQEHPATAALAAAVEHSNAMGRAAEATQLLETLTNHAVPAEGEGLIALANARAIIQTAAQPAGITQAQVAEIAARSSNTAMDATGQAPINASTKDRAAQAQHNAQMTATKPALQAASGRMQEPTQTMMQKTCNAVTLFATNPQMYMIRQKQQVKTHARTLWTMTAT